jgi:putative FmdB family regulatory protein
MPLYEFLCRACGRRFERLVRIGREGEVRCAACGCPDIQKLFSTFGIHGAEKAVSLSSSAKGCATCSSKSCSTCH